VRLRRKKNVWRVLCVVTLATMLLVSMPSAAYAGPFDALGRILRGAGRIAGKVLQAPGRAVQHVTKPLPRPIQILATVYVTRRIALHGRLGRVMRSARDVQAVAKDAQFVTNARDKLRQAYKDQAEELRQQAKAIDDKIAEIKKSPQAGDIRRMVDLRVVQQQLNDAANQVQAQAARINNDRVVKLLLQKGLLRKLGETAKNVVKTHISDELARVIGPNVIKRFTEGGINPEAMVELIIAGDAARIGKQQGFDKEFRQKLREELKKRLKEDIDFFKKNWRSELDRIIAEIVKKRKAEVATTDGDSEEESRSPPATGKPEPEGEGDSAGDGDSTDDGTAPWDVTPTKETWVVWYGDVGFGPIMITTKEGFEAETAGYDFPGGGQTADPVKKIQAGGGFATREEAMKWLDGQLSDVRFMSGVYAGMFVAEFQGETHNIEHIGFDPRDYP